MADILDGCGKFSTPLKHVASSIYEKKMKNGETREDEKDKIKEKVFLSYQRILSIAQDSDSIDRAITSMEIAVQNGNLEVDKIAVKLAIDAVNMRKNEDLIDGYIDNNDGGDFKKIEPDGFTEEKGNSEFPKEFIPRYEYTDKDFESVFEGARRVAQILGKKRLDDIIKRANEGDIEAAKQIVSYQAAQTLIAKNENLKTIPENDLPRFLHEMIFLGRSKDVAENAELYNLMAKKLPEDVFTINVNGEKVVDDKKVMNLYKISCSGKESDIDSYKKGIIEAAKSYVGNKENQFETVDDLIEESTITGQKEMMHSKFLMIEDLISKEPKSPEDYTKLNSSVKEFSQLGKKYPDAMLRLTKSISEQENRNEKKSFEILLATTMDSLIQGKRNKTFVEDQYTDELIKELYSNLTEILIDQDVILAKNIFFFGKLVEISPENSKEMLDYFVSNQGNNPKVVGYIQDLGNKYSEYKKKSIKNNEKEGQNVETKNQFKDDGEEPEGP